jgi:cytochrome c
MKVIVAALAAATALVFADSALAADAKAAETLAKNSGCFACHATDKKLVGPSYKDVAAKYRNDKNAEANLVKKVKAGGKGVWGDVPMPPNAHVKDADIKTIVQWILSLK